MLKKYIEDGFGIKEDLNCSEQIVYGANDVYKLGLDKNSLRLAAGFGGGMGAEDACGVVTGAAMVFSRIFIKERARESGLIKEINREFNKRFIQYLGTTNCKDLKEIHCKDIKNCKPIIVAGAGIIDDLLKERGFTEYKEYNK